MMKRIGFLELFYISLFINIFVLVLIVVKCGVSPHHTHKGFKESLLEAQAMAREQTSLEKQLIQYQLQKVPELNRAFNEGLDKLIETGQYTNESIYGLLPKYDLREIPTHSDDERKPVRQMMIREGGLDSLHIIVERYENEMESIFRERAAAISYHEIVDSSAIDSIVGVLEATSPRFDKEALKKAFRHATFGEAQMILRKINLDVSLEELAWVRAMVNLLRKPNPHKMRFSAFINFKDGLTELGDDLVAQVALGGILTDLHEDSWISVDGTKYEISKEGCVTFKKYPNRTGLQELKMGSLIINGSTRERSRGSSIYTYRVVE